MVKKNKKFDERLEYAIKRFTDEKIPYRIQSASDGQVNLYKNFTIVMSFWTYTGQINIVGKLPVYSQRGIESCIKNYKKIVQRKNIKRAES